MKFTYLQVDRIYSEMEYALSRISQQELEEISINAETCRTYLNLIGRRRVLNEVYKSVGLEPIQSTRKS